jgi:hypothetical protein
MDQPVKYAATKPYREDRRANLRYPISGLVQFQWRGADGHDTIGVTRDIGKGGVFIESDSIPPVASVLKLIVTLPAESKGDVTLQLGGIGVVRNVGRGVCQKRGFGTSAVFHVEIPILKA